MGLTSFAVIVFHWIEKFLTPETQGRREGGREGRREGGKEREGRREVGLDKLFRHNFENNRCTKELRIIPRIIGSILQ